MTTFARLEKSVEETSIRMELRSVNHRYLDFTMRSPRWMMPIEERIRRKVANILERGKVELFVSIHGNDLLSTRFRTDINYVKAYLDAVKQLKDETGLSGDLDIVKVLELLRDAVVQEQEDVDIEGVWSVLEGAIDELLEQARLQSEAEGASLSKDIEKRIERIQDLLSSVEDRKKEVLPYQKASLKNRIQETLGDVGLSEERILQEYAILADRLDITEELVRARSHIEMFRALMERDGSIGRRLDFLLQEIFREINTIASKAQDANIAQMVVELKGEVEKIREQVQNIV